MNEISPRGMEQKAQGRTYTIEGEYMGYEPEQAAESVWHDYSVNVPGPEGSQGGFDAVVILQRIPAPVVPEVIDAIEDTEHRLMENVIEIRDDETGEIVVDDWNDIKAFEERLAGKALPPKEVGGSLRQGGTAPLSARGQEEMEEEYYEREQTDEERLEEEELDRAEERRREGEHELEV